jgi:hypothetical protein
VALTRAHVLRVNLLGRGEADQVGEEDGDGLAPFAAAGAGSSSEALQTFQNRACWILPVGA